ncbi:TldD/PmbA family protein [bacterium]|nr:TldD/PmbA family protein [candidate division CSSED10-310 bacterium]
MKAFIQDAIKSVPADFIEVRIEDTSQLSISFSGRNLVKAQQTRDFGGYVRALVKGGWGFISFNQPEKLKEYVRIAVDRAAGIGGGDARLAPVPIVESKTVVELDPDKDPRKVTFEEKVAMFRRFADGLLAGGEKIISSGVGYNEVFRHIVISTSEGTYLDNEGLWCAGGLSAIGRDGPVVQSVHSGFGTQRDWSDIVAGESAIAGVIRDTEELLGAAPVKGGRYTVILDPRLAGVFIHEAFGHLSEADTVADNPKLGEKMRLGTRFGQDHLNIIDCGNLEDERGSYAYDDEGTPSTHTYLVKDGILAGRLHSRETAARLGEAPTGNARTINYRFPPICRMSNTYIGPGGSSFEEMLEGVEHGLYVVGGGSGNTSTGLFTFNAERAMVIEKGRLGGLVRDLMLTGNVFETMADIDMVAGDLKRSRSGYCGKSYGQRMQYPLMVSMGSPHIRIQNVLIGGC